MRKRRKRKLRRWVIVAIRIMMILSVYAFALWAFLSWASTPYRSIYPQ